jgi:hypothetical protein
MSKRKKARCPHPQCNGGFIYEFDPVLPARYVPGQVGVGVRERRMLCPVCQGLGQVRRKGR